MKELGRQWWIFALRSLAALLLAGCLAFVPNLLSSWILAPLSLPFIVAAFALYVVTDAVLLIVLASRVSSRPLQRTVGSQAAVQLLIGIALMTARLQGSDLHLLILLSVVQSGAMAVYEFLAGRHFRRHSNVEH